MVRIADDSMTPNLREIWKTCFGGQDSYVDFIFTRLISTRHALVYIAEKGAPVSMLHWRPLRFTVCGTSMPGAYIYGVGTLPDYRGRGYSRLLLGELQGLLAGQGTALSALVPATESLFEFYRKQGYETAFHYKKPTIGVDASGTSERDIPELSTESLSRLCGLRNGFFSGSRLFAEWDEDYLGFAEDECILMGGETLRFSRGGGAQPGYAVCVPRDEDIYVPEASVRPGELEALAAALRNRYGNRAVTMRVPADFSAGPECVPVPQGMLRWYDRDMETLFNTSEGGAPWLAFAMD